MTVLRRGKFVLAGAAMTVALAFGLGGIAGAATLPYTENFDDDTPPTATPAEPAPESGTFAAENATRWAVTSLGGGNNVYRNAYTTENTATYALVNFAGSLGGSAAVPGNFTVVTDFVANGGTGGTSGNATWGVAALQNSTAASGYFADIALDGLLRIVEGGTVRTSAGRGAVSTGSTYTMLLSGVYSDADTDGTADTLTLTTQLFGPGADPTPLTFVDTAANTIASGTFFGFRDRNNASDLNVDFDNFGVFVPEPGSAGLLAAGSLLVLARRRRRR